MLEGILSSFHHLCAVKAKCLIKVIPIILKKLGAKMVGQHNGLVSVAILDL